MGVDCIAGALQSRCERVATTYWHMLTRCSISDGGVTAILREGGVAAGGSL